MPLVDVVPNSTTSTSAPGWAYVPDTGYDPSKAPIVPSGARKRARNTAFNSGPSSVAGKEALSARQQSKIVKHLAELDKDSTRDVQIVVPGKPRDVGHRTMAKSGKMTPAVRKILGSQKTWANYLADEEAMLMNAPSGGVVVQQVQAAERRESGEGVRRGSGRPAKVTPGRKKRASMVEKQKADANEMDVDTSSVSQTPATPYTQIAQIPGQQAAALTSATEGDDDPFLKSRLPPLPSQAEIDTLLAAPPLSYNAARAGPTTSTAPPRQFCEMCGYWGRARCMKCGVRVCGLECKTQHDETRCLKFYA